MIHKVREWGSRYLIPELISTFAVFFAGYMLSYSLLHVITIAYIAAFVETIVIMLLLLFVI